MSIPKEPRQLMINVMYIVLTALLALNVSAEVFNAFDMVNDGLSKSSIALDDQNKRLPAEIKERAKAKPIYAPYAAKVDKISAYGKELSDFIDEITDHIVDQTGDKNGVVDDKDYEFVGSIKKPKGERNFDITTKYLVDKGKGMELHDKVLEYRQKFLELIEPNERAAFASKIPLTIDDESWKLSKTKRRNWADFNFNHMPVGAVLPIFAKYKNDVKATEAAVFQHFLGKMGGRDVVLDEFTVASAPVKSYIIKGEKFETEVFLTAFASSASNTGVSITINGGRVPVDKNGVAKYTAVGTQTGVKKYNAAVSVTNPVTGEVKTYRKEFEYEVGERSVAISATKMNVFYIGVPNPVEVSAAGISSNLMKVSMSGGGGGSISKNSDGTYTVTVSSPTPAGEFAYIDVSAPGIAGAKKGFRVKRIPDPVAKLGSKLSGAISSGEFKAQGGIIPRLEGFDFDAKCDIEGFRLVRSPKREDPKVAENRGGRYGADAQALVNVAKAGDRYFFENVRCKCPGDKASREINPLTFVIQ
ncbi:MAG: GldM family protein [Deltaproteobacteria bacterium]